MLFGPASRGPILPARYDDIPRIIRNQQRAQFYQGVRGIANGLYRNGFLGAAANIAIHYMAGGSDTTPATKGKAEPNTTGKKRKKLGISDKKNNSGPNKRLRFDEEPTSDNPGEGRGVPPARNEEKMATSGHAEDEVKVIPPPKNISKIHPEYFTVNLPYIAKTSSSNVSNFSGNNTPWAIIRLNSIHDPIRNFRQVTVDAEGNPVADPVNTKNSQPQGRDLWAGHFKYYRVLKTYVRLEFWSTRYIDPIIQNSEPYDETYVVGYELIDNDAQISNGSDMFQITKNAKREYLLPAPSMATGNGTASTRGVQHPNMIAMNYTYTPGNFVHHVQEDGVDARWTPIDENPSIEHDMAIRILPLSNTDPTQTHGHLGCIIKLGYDVQFREPVDSFFKTLDTGDATDPDPTL